MPKKNRKQGSIIEYPVDITVETAETATDTPESPTEDQQAEAQDQILEITQADAQAEPPASESQNAAPEESPVEESQTEADEAPASDASAEDQPSDSPDAEPQAEADPPQTESTGDVYRDNWQATIAEIAQQPRMRRGYTERAIRLYPRQVAMIEDVGAFRKLTPNKVIQTSLNSAIDHRFALIANTLIADPLVQANPADLDALLMEWLQGQIAKVRAEAQEAINPATRSELWQKVGRMEEIRDFYRHHPAFQS